MRPIPTFLEGEAVTVTTRSYVAEGICCGHIFTPDNRIRYVVAYPSLGSGSGFMLHLYPPSCLVSRRHAVDDNV